jgi:hypothetical protein
MGAPAYDNHCSSSKYLLPSDPLGKRFLQYFYHGWSFIEAPVPQWEERPNWRTEKRYPLEPRNLWKKHQDPELLLGLSFDKFTKYFVLDIDRKSKNHPENSRENFDGILQALESIGMGRVVVVNSSESEGIHLYYFLPYPVYSIALAVAVKQALFQAGYRLKNGQLEIFPNPKPYNPDKITSFRSHRLPLQKNSFLLDWDLQPISQSVETLLDWADLTASCQDMEPLGEALKAAEQWLSAQYYLKRGKNSAEQFCWDLEEMIKEGWTGEGQTNDLLLTFAKYGIIFKHHQGEDLVDYMLETSLSSPGYTEFCNHQHEIEKRVRERATSALNYPYYPYRGKPPRKRTYKEQFGEDGVDNIIYLHPSRERHLKTIERIRAVIATLKSEGTFPETAYKRTQAIIKKSKAVYGKGVSQTTLHKKEYLPLWHPGYENTESVEADSYIEKYPVLPDPWETASEEPKAEQERVLENLHVPDPSSNSAEAPKLLQGQGFKSLHVTPHYEGKCSPGDSSSGELRESASDEEEKPQFGGVATGFNQEQQPQAVSDSVEINLENQTQGIIFLNGTIPEIYSIQEIINFKSATFLIPQILLEYDFEQFIDNLNLSIIGSSDGGKFSKIDKLNLSFTQSVYSLTTKTAPDSSASSEPSFEAPTEADNLSEKEIHPDNHSTPSSPSQASQEQSSNSPPPENVPQPSTTAEHFVNPPECSTTAEHFLENNNSSEVLASLEHREAIRFEFKAQKKAKQYQQEFFALRNIHLMPRLSQDYEYLIKNYLMFKSSHAFARQKATEWFSNHQELVTNARELGLWDYLEQLPPPDF